MTTLFDPRVGPFELTGTNGRAIVLVHGFTGVPLHFRPLAGYLNSLGFTTVAPLLAGHGTAPEDLRTAGIAEWEDSVGAAYDEARVAHDEVHLVGLSMGGLLSILVGSDRGADTISTINSPIVFRDKKIHLSKAFHRFQRWTAWPDRPPPKLDEELQDLWVTYPHFPTIAAARLLEISRKAIRTAPQVTCPTLVIQSLADETVDPVSGSILAKAFRGESRLVWLEHSIHNALLDSERTTIHRAVWERIGGDATPGRPD